MRPEISDAQRLVNYQEHYIFNRYDSANETIIPPKKDVNNKRLIERIQELEQDLVQVKILLLTIERKLNTHLDDKSVKVKGFKL